MELNTFRRIIFFLNISIVAWAIVASPAQDLLYHFQENRLVTFFSAIQLAWISLISFLIFDNAAPKSFSLTHQSLENHPQHIWLLIALGFLWLSFDEVLMLHEQLDFLLHDLYQWQENAFSDRIDDLIIFAYFLIAGMIIYQHRAALINYKDQIFPYLKNTISLILLMIVFDVLTNRNDIITHPSLFQVLSLAEELAKLIIEIYFLLMVYGCWKQTLIWRIHEASQ